MDLLHFPPYLLVYLLLVFPHVPEARHTGSSPQDKPFPVQIPSHALSLSPLSVPYLENSSAALSQAVRADSSCTARAAPDSPPRPALTQRQPSRHPKPMGDDWWHSYATHQWIVLTPCHEIDKHTSRSRTGKINLRNHELYVLPPHTILLLLPFSAFPPSQTTPLSLQSQASSPFPSSRLSPLISLMPYAPLQWLIKTFDTCRWRIKTSSHTPAEGTLRSHLFRACTCHQHTHQHPDGTSLQ